MTDVVNPPRFSPHQERGGIKKASGGQEMMSYSRRDSVQGTPWHQTTRSAASVDLARRQGTMHVVVGEHTLSEGRRAKRRPVEDTRRDACLAQAQLPLE